MRERTKRSPPSHYISQHPENTRQGLRLMGCGELAHTTLRAAISGVRNMKTGQDMGNSQLEIAERFGRTI